MRTFFLETAAGERFALSKDTLKVGRDATCDVAIDQPGVSRHHATLHRKGDAWTVVDEGSRNGTFVADVQLKANVPTPVQAGQTIVFGTLRTRLAGDGASNGGASAGAQVAPEALGATREYAAADLLPKAARETSPALDRLLTDVLMRAQAALFPAQPADLLLDALLHVLASFVPAELVAVQTLEGGEVRAIAVLSPGAAAGKEPKLSRSFAEKVLHERKALLIRDRASDAEFQTAQSMVQAGITSVLAAPIYDGNEMFGVLYAHVLDGARELSEVDLTVTTLLASLGGTALLASRMMSDLLREQARLQVENEALKKDLAKKASAKS